MTDSMIQQLQELRKWFRGRVLTREPLAGHTSFRIGGPADFYVFPRDMEDLAALVEYCRSQDIPRFVIGNGTNLLVSDAGFRGIVIDLADLACELKFKDGMIITGSSVLLGTFLKFCMERGLGGLEMLSGIPGNVGGGIMLNAGAYGGEISDHLVSLRAMDGYGILEKYGREDIHFGYRSISLDTGSIIVDAVFRMNEGNPKEIEMNQRAILRKRKESQPLTLPSAGSVFKRPAGDYAGRLIEEAGCKGLRIGDAMVSKKHANFIVNCNVATANHVLAVINEVRERVHKQFDVQLETEIHFLGFDE